MGRKQARDFQLGDYWLSKRAGSPFWHRTWFDAWSRQTRRVSLGVEDFERAKQALTDWYVLEQAPVQATPEEVSLAEVFARYYDGHAKTQRSGDRARSALQIWLDFYGDAPVSALHDVRQQEAFQTYLKGRGQSPGSMKRILTVGRAAINRAWKRGEIRSAPFVQMVAVKDAPPKGRPLEIAEIARLIAVAPPHLRDFIFWMIGTGARPDAILDLTWRQVDQTAGVIQLNPPGRQQTKKHRPTVRLPSNLTALTSPPLPGATHVVEFAGAPVKAIRNSWRRARSQADLDAEVQPYSLRHTVARWLRTQSVPAWEVAAQLGHSVSEFSMTERYAPYDPAYLKAATQAIERLIDKMPRDAIAKTA